MIFITFEYIRRSKKQWKKNEAEFKGNTIYAGYILKVRPEGFLEGLHVEREIREQAGMTQYFVLRDWMDGIVIS